ncbi:hypothetical protein TUM15750_20280 [Neisseria gonorrhoeae]|nr:hypothetical protein TUM15750_20280 [Neisseria gonorrhoeae]GFL55067.1 hypothetical protein TUM15772_19720 [Neisseria gonorrhoeae]SCW17578.1 hypothetical protein ESCNG_450003 [Neisseria gonorrhoeae]SCW19182.1 hypothetical protein ESCNG_430007 [Neisseria gonorrhoeae]
MGGYAVPYISVSVKPLIYLGRSFINCPRKLSLIAVKPVGYQIFNSIYSVHFITPSNRYKYKA